MFKINSGFMGNFKLGDNINYNLKILAYFYDNFAIADIDRKNLLYKPIIIFLVSITEAVLYDFHQRIKCFTTEGVKNIAQEVIDYIRGKESDKLEQYITSAKKHNLFEMQDKKFYDILDDLRKLRHRIHIQNTKNHFEKDDLIAFNATRKIIAEKALEKILRIMSQKYLRGEYQSGFVKDFELPWESHFDPDPSPS